MLIAGMLTFSVFSKSKISMAKAIIPDGKEYISVEKFPLNKLPNITFTVSPKKEYKVPAVKKVSKMNMLESPNFAPGIIIGGNKLSKVKAIIASAVKIAVIVIFLTDKAFFIITP